MLPFNLILMWLWGHHFLLTSILNHANFPERIRFISIMSLEGRLKLYDVTQTLLKSWHRSVPGFTSTKCFSTGTQTVLKLDYDYGDRTGRDLLSISWNIWENCLAELNRMCFVNRSAVICALRSFRSVFEIPSHFHIQTHPRSTFTFTELQPGSKINTQQTSNATVVSNCQLITIFKTCLFILFFCQVW